MPLIPSFTLSTQEALSLCVEAVFGETYDVGTPVEEIDSYVSRSEEPDNRLLRCAADLLKAFYAADMTNKNKAVLLPVLAQHTDISPNDLYAYLLSATFIAGYADFLIAFEAASMDGGLGLEANQRYHAMLSACLKSDDGLGNVLSSDEEDNMRFHDFLTFQHERGALAGGVFGRLSGELCIEAMMDEGVDSERGLVSLDPSPGSSPQLLRPTPLRSVFSSASGSSPGLFEQRITGSIPSEYTPERRRSTAYPRTSGSPPRTLFVAARTGSSPRSDQPMSGFSPAS